MAEQGRLSWKTGAAVAGGLALPAYYLLFRRWHARCGATDEEVAIAMPGDELVERPKDVTTRAVTIRARPEDVWSWLAQMGRDRGGLYSYDWIDEVLGVLDEPSSDVILPEFQTLEAGDVIPIGGGPDWPVAAAEPNRSLVLDIRPEEGMAISWSFQLRELDDEHTRLVLRIRIRASALVHLAYALPVVDFGSFIMTRKMLLGIKERAEAHAASR